MEGIVGDVFVFKADGDDVFVRFGRCVVDVKGIVMVFNYVYVEFCFIRRGYCVCYFFFVCCFGVYCDYRFFFDLDAGV